MSSRRPNGFTRSAALIALPQQDFVPGRAAPTKRRRRKPATVIDECLEAPTEAVQPRACGAYPSGWCWRRARAALRGRQGSKVFGMSWDAPCRSFMDTTSDRLRLLVPAAGISCPQLEPIAPSFIFPPSTSKYIHQELRDSPNVRLQGQHPHRPLSPTKPQRTCFQPPNPVKPATGVVT